MNELQKRMTESQFTETVIELAKYNRWMVSHFRAARTERGWRTPLQGHAGFPDLILARGGVVLLVELKTVKGKVTRDQQQWAGEIGTQYRLWRPTDLEAIKEELR